MNIIERIRIEWPGRLDDSFHRTAIRPSVIPHRSYVDAFGGHGRLVNGGRSSSADAACRGTGTSSVWPLLAVKVFVPAKPSWCEASSTVIFFRARCRCVLSLRHTLTRTRFEINVRGNELRAECPPACPGARRPVASLSVMYRRFQVDACPPEPVPSGVPTCDLYTHPPISLLTHAHAMLRVWYSSGI